MKKTLIAIGKGLVAVGLLWPVPISLFVTAISWISGLTGIPFYRPLLFLMYIPDWTRVTDIGDRVVLYWWPFLIIMSLGIVICVITTYKQNNATENATECTSPVMLEIAFYASAIIIGFNLLMLVIVGIYYYYKYIEYTALPTFGLLILGLLIWFGWQYYCDEKSKNKNN